MISDNRGFALKPNTPLATSILLILTKYKYKKISILFYFQRNHLTEWCDVYHNQQEVFNEILPAQCFCEVLGCD